MADNIQTLLDAFNGVIKTAENYADTGASAGNKLFNDVGSVSKSRQASLASPTNRNKDNESANVSTHSSEDSPKSNKEK